MLTQLDDISAFPFKCSHKVFVIVIRDVIPYLNFAETYWKPLHIIINELHICAITTHSMRSDWPKIWHKNYYDFNLLQNRHFTTDFM